MSVAVRNVRERLEEVAKRDFIGSLESIHDAPVWSRRLYDLSMDRVIIFFNSFSICLVSLFPTPSSILFRLTAWSTLIIPNGAWSLGTT